jgi:hypothetical protein
MGYSRKWEKVSRVSLRLRVFEGWLVTSHFEGSLSMCFLPDKEGQWILKDNDITSFSKYEKIK